MRSFVRQLIDFSIFSVDWILVVDKCIWKVDLDIREYAEKYVLPHSSYFEPNIVDTRVIAAKAISNASISLLFLRRKSEDFQFWDK